MKAFCTIGLDQSELKTITPNSIVFGIQMNAILEQYFSNEENQDCEIAQRIRTILNTRT